MESGETPDRPILPADWMEFLADRERDIKRPPVPPKRRQPKIKRHVSARQQIALTQSPNMTRAIYTPEHERNQTPTNDDLVGTHEVGPGDEYNNVYRAGKATIESPTGYAKKRYRRSSTGRSGVRQGTAAFEELLSEYDDI